MFVYYLMSVKVIMEKLDRHAGSRLLAEVRNKGFFKIWGYQCLTCLLWESTKMSNLFNYICLETELLTAYTKEKEEEKLKFESQLESRFHIY